MRLERANAVAAAKRVHTAASAASALAVALAQLEARLERAADCALPASADLERLEQQAHDLTRRMQVLCDRSRVLEHRLKVGKPVGSTTPPDATGPSR